MGLRRPQQREPIVSISRFGIPDRRPTQRLIPWQDISGLRLGVYPSSHALLIEFQDLGVERRHMGARGVVTAVLSLGERSRAHVGVTLGPLQRHNAGVLALCVGHLKRVHADQATASAAPCQLPKPDAGHALLRARLPARSPRVHGRTKSGAIEGAGR